MNKIIRALGFLVCLLTSFSFISTQVFAQSSAASNAQVKQDMDVVYEAFLDLQKYMANKPRFVDEKNQAVITGLLRTMSSRFHKVEELSPRYTQEPGFVNTIKSLTDMLDDVRNRFAEGNKEYALWRLKTSYSYCISCHTRFEVPMDFVHGDTNLSGLNSYEKGEFYLATRQFEKARTQFLLVVEDPSLRLQRLDALRKWLVIYTRVQPAPQEAIIQLNKIRALGDLPKYEDQEVQDWLASLRRWQNESKMKVDDLRRAQHLISQGVNLNASLADSKGTVELLRGTSILHRMMTVKGTANNDSRAQVLYLLGLAYSNLPDYIADELPEVFLEQCIREFPGTEQAKKSYIIYKDVVTLGYTGSGGTRIPAEVNLQLKELYNLAYGVVSKSPERI